MALEAQDALSTALAAIADNTRSRPKNLTLHCPLVILLDLHVLRRLCSSVRQLSLSGDELLLMAWGGDALHARVWTTHSVQVFTVPCSLNFLTTELVVTTLAVALPSLQYLVVDHKQEASRVSALLQRLGSCLVFLRSCTVSLLQLPSAAASCTALESLCIFDYDACECDAEQISAIFSSLTACPSLTELNVTACPPCAWPRRDFVYLCALPQLRFLHIRVHRNSGESGLRLPCSILIPNLTHLALVLGKSQLKSLLNAINTQRLPQLTRCHVSWNRPSSE